MVSLDDRGRENRLNWLPLPPNRTGGSPASGSPVGGLTSERSDERSSRRGREHGEKPAATPPRPPSLHHEGVSRPAPRFPRGRTESPTGTARRHWAGLGAAGHPHSSTFLRPFAPGPLRPFLARMDALTPARAVAPVLGISPAASPSAPREQVSLIYAPGLRAIPSPTTCGRSASPGHVTPRWVEPRRLPNGSTPNGNSGLRHSLAGSPHHAGRIEFVILRTGRSPPAAPHPVSPRRSCSRLQVTLTWRGLSPLRPCALSGALAPTFRSACAGLRF